MKYLSFAIRFFIMFIITFVLLAFIISLLSDEKIGSSDYVAIILVTPIIAIVNTTFVSILYISKINTKVLTHVLFSFIEIVLYFISSAIIHSVFNNCINTDEMFFQHEITHNGQVIANITEIKWYYSEEAQLCYTYLLLSLIYIIPYLIRLKKRTHSNRITH